MRVYVYACVCMYVCMYVCVCACAHLIVQNFIKTCHAQGLRHVLIITGKGQHSGNRGPVLKTAVVQWLKKNGHPYLREFRDAPPRFGGSGAVWVELK